MRWIDTQLIGDLESSSAEHGQGVFQPAWTAEASMSQQAMIADIDAERPKQVKSRKRPGQPRPAEQPRHAGKQRKHVKADDACDDGQVDAQGFLGIQNTSSPEPTINDTGAAKHGPCPLRPKRMRLSRHCQYRLIPDYHICHRQQLKPVHFSDDAGCADRSPPARVGQIAKRASKNKADSAAGRTASSAESGKVFIPKRSPARIARVALRS